MSAGRCPASRCSSAAERFIAGEWDDAQAELESSLALADETGETYSVTLAPHLLALDSFHRDDLGRAAAAVAAANRQLTDPRLPLPTDWAAWPHALLQEASGESARALESMTAPWEESARLGISVECPSQGRIWSGAGDGRRRRRTGPTGGGGG